MKAGDVPLLIMPLPKGQVWITFIQHTDKKLQHVGCYVRPVSLKKKLPVLLLQVQLPLVVILVYLMMVFAPQYGFLFKK